MKSTFSKLTFMAIFILALAFTFSCLEKVGSSGNAENITNSEKGDGNNSIEDITIDKRIIGTWLDENGTPYIFNFEGYGERLTEGKFNFRRNNFKYAFFSNKIIISSESESEYSRSAKTNVMDYVFSKDSKTFILYNSMSATWLTKMESEEAK